MTCRAREKEIVTFNVHWTVFRRFAIGQVLSRDFLNNEGVLGRLWSQQFQLDNFRRVTRKAGVVGGRGVGGWGGGVREGGGAGGGGVVDPVVLLAFRIYLE